MDFVIKGFSSPASSEKKVLVGVIAGFFFLINYAFWELINATDDDTKHLNLPFMAVWPFNSFTLHPCTVSSNPEFGRKQENEGW